MATETCSPPLGECTPPHPDLIASHWCCSVTNTSRDKAIEAFMRHYHLMVQKPLPSNTPDLIEMLHQKLRQVAWPWYKDCKEPPTITKTAHEISYGMAYQVTYTLVINGVTYIRESRHMFNDPMNILQFEQVKDANGNTIYWIRYGDSLALIPNLATGLGIDDKDANLLLKTVSEWIELFMCYLP